MNSEFPILYIMHGGGPMPLLSAKEQLSLQNFLKEVPKTISIPKAILVISAHWEEDITTILSKEKPDLLFDYYGFPSETYNYKYPTRNDLDIVKKISELLKKNNIPFKLDDKRDYDHGVFVPLLLMYPKADIPVLQISLNSSLNPKIHIEIGIVSLIIIIT